MNRGEYEAVDVRRSSKQRVCFSITLPPHGLASFATENKLITHTGGVGCFATQLTCASNLAA